MDPDAAMAGATMPAASSWSSWCGASSSPTSSPASWLSSVLRACFGAVHFGLFVWIGFPVIILTGSVLWRNTSLKVAAIHAGDWFVKMMVIPIMRDVLA